MLYPTTFAIVLIQLSSTTTSPGLLLKNKEVNYILLPHLTGFFVEFCDTWGPLIQTDSRFRHLHGTLDSYMYFHKLQNTVHSEGFGRQTKHAEIVSSEDEDQLWREGTMGTITPAGLQNAAFFLESVKCFVCVEVKSIVGCSCHNWNDTKIDNCITKTYHRIETASPF